jgi:hypothetical protein
MILTSEQIADMRRRHQHGHTSNPRRDYCYSDNQDWPCDVVQLLDAFDGHRVAGGADSEWREHVAAPPAAGVQACSRCHVTLWVRPVGTSGPRWQEGTRVASDGAVAREITGWPFTPCEPWRTRIGDHPERRSAT